VTGRNKRAIEDHFDNNQELEMALRAKGKAEQADMVKNILTEGVECIFVRQPEQLGLGHAVLCAERAVGNDPFAVLLADDFLTYESAGVTADLARAFLVSGKTQLSVMEVNGPDISKYGVVVPNGEPGSVAGLVEKPDADKAPSKLASIGRYVLTPDIFDILRNQPTGAGGEIQLADAINTQAANNAVEAVTEGQSVYVPLGAVHRMENPWKMPMVIIEVQIGTCLDENDIVRYADIYSRT